VKTVKTLIIIFLLLQANISFAQEVFTDTLTNREYLFLCGVSHDFQKMKLHDGSKIIWKSYKELEQSDLLSSKNFLSKIFSRNLYFVLQGHNWSAKMTGDSLNFPDYTTGELLKFNIKIYPDDDLMTRFSVMFKSSDNRAFGVVTYKGWTSGRQEICTLDNGDDESFSLFDVYLCIDGKVYRGCVYIESEKP
jgi:hypothetical protein